MPTTLISSSYTDAGIQGNDANYVIARSTSTTIDDVAADTFVGQVLTLGLYLVQRALLEFDTSIISDAATVDSVILHVKIEQKSTEGGEFAVGIRKSDWASPVDEANREANYDGALAATLDQVLGNTGDYLDGEWMVSPALDPTWVNLTGMTRYALVSAQDANNFPPTDPESVLIWCGRAVDPADAPYLEIAYTVPDGGGPDGPSPRKRRRRRGRGFIAPKARHV